MPVARAERIRAAGTTLSSTNGLFQRGSRDDKGSTGENSALGLKTQELFTHRGRATAIAGVLKNWDYVNGNEQYAK